jgi:hypothetical protein
VASQVHCRGEGSTNPIALASNGISPKISSDRTGRNSNVGAI